MKDNRYLKIDYNQINIRVVMILNQMVPNKIAFELYNSKTVDKEHTQL